MEFACPPGACIGILWVHFLPQSKDIQVRLICDTKLAVGVNGCLSLCVNVVIRLVTFRMSPACQLGLAKAPL